MIRFENQAGGTGYIEVRLDPNRCTMHQAVFAVAGLAASKDADGMIPPGLPLQASGAPVSGAGQTVTDVVGPGAVRLGAANHFGNTIKAGHLVRNAVEDNLGRVLTADELSALAAGGFKLV